MASSPSPERTAVAAAAPPTRDNGDGEETLQYSPLLPLPYRILVEFAYKHVDFHVAELESVLECNGIVLLRKDKGRVWDGNDNKKIGTTTKKKEPARASTYYCRIVPSPSPPSASLPSGDAASQGVENVDDYRPPYAVLEFSKPDPTIGETIMSQCTLVRCAMELWGMGDSVEACVASTRDFATRNGSTLVGPYKAADRTWKITVHALGSTIPLKEQEGVRLQLSFLGFDGPVQLKNPDNEFLFLKEVRLDATGPAGNLPARSGDSSSSSSNSITAPEESTRERSLLACYFGRVLGGIRTTKNRAGLEQYTLKKRAYLGPTSMDAELAFVMASLGKVKVGSFVYDPFVGTGSILVACALKGAAHVVGADIDIRVLRGKGPTENIQSNFAQFNLPRPELLRTDNAIYHRHFRSHIALYDAIVADPPYGIRAGARKCGSKLDQPRPVPDDHRSTHIPQTRPYPVSDVMADLLDVAARTLVMGGRLVYIVPSLSDFDPEDDLPRHDCLRLVHSCFQPLQGDLGRRVIAMEKVTEYDAARRDSYLSTIWKNGPQSAEKIATIREKLLDAAKKKPRYEEKLAMRRQKRKQNRKAKQAAKKQESAPYE